MHSFLWNISLKNSFRRKVNIGYLGYYFQSSIISKIFKVLIFRFRWKRYQASQLCRSFEIHFRYIIIWMRAFPALSENCALVSLNSVLSKCSKSLPYSVLTLPRCSLVAGKSATVWYWYTTHLFSFLGVLLELCCHHRLGSMISDPFCFWKIILKQWWKCLFSILLKFDSWGSLLCLRYKVFLFTRRAHTNKFIVILLL